MQRYDLLSIKGAEMYAVRTELNELQNSNDGIQARGFPTDISSHECAVKKTVLLADDETIVLEVSAEILNVLGYNVLTAENGTDALSIFKSDSKNIDLVILDMIMPGMTTSEVVNAMQDIKTDVKILLVSGRKIDESTKNMMKNGYDGFIQKPFSIPMLSSVVRDILDEE